MGLLGRLAGLGRALVTRGFGGLGSTTSATVIPAVCGDTATGLTSRGRTAIASNPAGSTDVGATSAASTQIAPTTTGSTPISNC